MRTLVFNLPEAKAITLYNIWEAFIPSTIIFSQIYLLLGETATTKGGTKYLRLALLPLALGACWHVFAHLVVPYDQLACFNFGMGVAMQHLAITSLRWSFANEPPKRRANAPPHNRFFRSIDLLYNARMVSYEEGPNLGDSRLDKKQHFIKHLEGFITHYLWYDVSSYLVQRVQPDGFGSFRGGDVGSFAKGVASALTFAVGWLVYHGICLLWHVCALGGMAIGHAGEEYPKLMDQPLLSDSMLDFWKRWHQLIRGLLMFVTSILPRLTPRLVVVLMVFFFSGQLHTVGQLVITRALRIPLPSAEHPNPLIMVDRMAQFFIACGCASIAEVIFKRVTGRKVRGWPGRIWLAIVLLLTAQGGAEEWYAMGFVGSMRGLIGMVPILSVVEWIRWVAGTAEAPWRRIDMS